MSVVLIIVVFVVSFWLNRKNTFNIDNVVIGKGITYLSYQEWNWWTHNEAYYINNDNWKILLKYEESHWAKDPNIIQIEISEENLQKIGEIIEENKMYSWDGFQRYNKDVYDWTSRNLTVYYDNEKYIWASWYMERPNWFHDKIGYLIEYLETLLSMK